MITLRTILLATFCSTLIACNNSNSTKEEPASTPEAQDAAYPYPALPDELRARLWNTCDYVDIIFYESPVSMSQTEAPAIRGTLGYLAGTPAIPDANCTSLGRISFMQQGEIIIEADMYSQNNCHYFLFLQDGNVVYAEALSNAGMNFFRQVEQRFREVVQ
ncbi:MAG: hypothetical protein R3330_19265 [Saprospiraceae bacterium]|nr:hypothetical protein [Saprospiraceae bacterium]